MTHAAAARAPAHHAGVGRIHGHRRHPLEVVQRVPAIRGVARVPVGWSTGTLEQPEQGQGFW